MVLIDLRILNSRKLKRTLTEMVVDDDFFENFASVTRRLFAPLSDVTSFTLLANKMS